MNENREEGIQAGSPARTSTGIGICAAPGPWFANAPEGEGERFAYVSTTKDGCGNIATCWSSTTHDALDNARLIAAAPDMLLALGACELMVSQGAAPPDWDWIRDIIAKAKGQP